MVFPLLMVISSKVFCWTNLFFNLKLDLKQTLFNYLLDMDNLKILFFPSGLHFMHSLNI